HRDIKPSNVLVALYDEQPVPKVIDFGVAKATGSQLTEQTLHTGFGTVVGTLEYMSPEQASFNQLDIDTRSDIYSLGVLLYELLALVVGIVGTTLGLAEAWRQWSLAELARKDEAERRLETEWVLHASRINLAQQAWESNNPLLALHSLESCRPNFRGWEHDYL